MEHFLNDLFYRFWVILPPPDEDNYQVTLELQEKDANLSQEPMMESVMNKVKLLPGLMKFMIPLGLVYFFEYFINQGLVGLLLKIPMNVSTLCLICSSS